jgi:transposase
MMASALARSKTIALGAFYRRMAARRGGLVANKALARKLAAWYGRVMVKGDDVVERGSANYEDQIRRGKERALRRLAKELGQHLTPVGNPS